MPQIGASAQVTLLNPVNNLVFSLEDASAPGVSIEYQAPPQPYGNPIQVTFLFACVQNHVYNVKVWESPGVTPTGVVRCGYSVTVSTNSVSIRLPIYAEVDVTPNWTSGTATVADSSYVGWTISKLTRNPDYLVFNDAPDNTKNDAVRNSNGFTLSGGVLLQANEQWCVEFAPQIKSSTPGTPSGPFSTGRIITADETLTLADLNTALALQSATSQLNVTFPPLSGVIDFTDWLYFFSNGGAHINAVLKANPGDKIQYGPSVDQLILGQCEDLSFFKAFGNWWPKGELFGMRTVGELLYNYNQTELNTLLCDGTEYLRADYPRLWAYISATADITVSQATWQSFVTIEGVTYYPNRNKFSLGNGTTTFRVPNMTNMMLKAVDGSTRLAGSNQREQLMQHQHEQSIGTLPTPLFGIGPSRVKGNYGAVATGVTDLTSTARNSDGTDMVRVGNKNFVDNAGAYCLIRI